jgi:hypothetical protein
MGYMSLMISQCYPVGFGYILYCCRMRLTLLIRFWCAIQVGKKFLHCLEGSVKWYCQMVQYIIRLYFSKSDIEISGGSGKKNWTDREKDCA